MHWHISILAFKPAGSVNEFVTLYSCEETKPPTNITEGCRIRGMKRLYSCVSAWQVLGASQHWVIHLESG